MHSDFEAFHHAGYDYDPKVDNSREWRRITKKTLIIAGSGNDSCCRGHPLEVEPLIIVESGIDV